MGGHNGNKPKVLQYKSFNMLKQCLPTISSKQIKYIHLSTSFSLRMPMDIQILTLF